MTAKDFIEKYREEFHEYMETEHKKHNCWIDTPKRLGIWYGYRFEEFIYDRVYSPEKNFLEEVCALLLNECDNITYRIYEIPVAERPVKLYVSQRSEDMAVLSVISREYTITGRVRMLTSKEIDVDKSWF